MGTRERAGVPPMVVGALVETEGDDTPAVGFSGAVDVVCAVDSLTSDVACVGCAVGFVSEVVTSATTGVKM